MSRPLGVRIKPSSRVVRSEAIIFTELDDVVVMMDAEEGSYYELNPVGARIWALAESGPRIAEVCGALVAEYEVVPDRCAEGVLAFLEELHRREVVQVLPADDRKGSGGQEPHDGSLARTTSAKAAAAPRRTEDLGAKLAWTTPDVRVLENRRVASTSGNYRNIAESPTYDNYGPS